MSTLSSATTAPASRPGMVRKFAYRAEKPATQHVEPVKNP